MARRLLMAGGALLIALVGGYFLLNDDRSTVPAVGWKAYAPSSDDALNVLIFGEKPEETSEEMGDWADYLNDFASGDSQVSVSFEDVSVCETLLTDSSLCGEPYSTLFVNSEGKALFYDGIIVEPQVYDHAGAALRAREITPMMRAFAADPVELK